MGTATTEMGNVCLIFLDGNSESDVDHLGSPVNQQKIIVMEKIIQTQTAEEKEQG